MKQLKFLVMMLIAASMTLASCQKKQAQSPVYSFSEEEAESAQTQTEENNIPPELLQKYEYVEEQNGIFVAKKENKAYFFDGSKQIFSTGADYWSVEDQYITAFVEKTNATMLYFFRNKRVLENIKQCELAGDNFFCKMPDQTYAFYSFDGEEKGSGLKNLAYLQKIDRNGYATGEAFYVFELSDESRQFYNEDGNLKYEKVPLRIWQKLALTYLFRDESEEQPYEWTYTYKINLNEFMFDHLSGIPTRNFYPAE